jgi:hypothetical protein
LRVLSDRRHRDRLASPWNDGLMPEVAEGRPGVRDVARIARAPACRWIADRRAPSCAERRLK